MPCAFLNILYNAGPNPSFVKTIFYKLQMAAILRVTDKRSKEQRMRVLGQLVCRQQGKHTQQDERQTMYALPTK